MDTTARAARSDDTTKLKMDGLRYVTMTLMDMEAEEALALLRLADKSTRGFHNIWIGSLLCPHRYSAAYHGDPAGYVPLIFAMTYII